MRWLGILLLCCLALACERDSLAEPPYALALMEVPRGFPDIPTPDDNAFTPERWTLGKRLFFDPAMSVDSSISCATCHLPAQAFSDINAVSLGVADRPGTRNSPTLANVAYHPYYTREGGVPTLEMQVLVPIQEHNEFDYNIVLLAERLQQDSTYRQQAADAYEREVDPFVITRALACFERSLLSGYSPYDQFTAYGKSDAMSTAAQRGMELFFDDDKTGCAQCHGGPIFSNFSFANNGLYTEYADEGRFRLTGEEADRALFKVPSLRNIALTAPYMHDGAMATLEDVMRHYQEGGKGHPQQSEHVRPLSLTETEIQDLLHFLHALTDETFINNPLFQE